MTTNNDKWLTSRQAAKLAGVSPATITRLTTDGALKTKNSDVDKRLVLVSHADLVEKFNLPSDTPTHLPLATTEVDTPCEKCYKPDNNVLFSLFGEKHVYCVGCLLDLVFRMKQLMHQ